jgi:hypothetical protein
MQKILSFLFVILFATSCNVLKHKTTGSLHVQKKTNEKTHQVRYEYTLIPSDSIVYNATLKEFDTIINKESLNQFLTAKFKKGRLVKTVCKTKPKQKFSKTITDKEKETEEKKDKKNTEVQYSIKQDHFTYIMLVLGLIIVLLIVVVIKK